MLLSGIGNKFTYTLSDFSFRNMWFKKVISAHPWGGAPPYAVAIELATPPFFPVE